MSASSATEERDSGALLEIVEVEKRFGGVRALRGANLTISRPGVVHGLIGQNGSGKSTLLGVLSGQLRPDGGAIRIEGEEVSLGSPAAALRRGIAMVSQETALAPHLTVAENVLMGRRLVRRGLRLDWRRSREKAAAVLARLDLDYDLEWRVGDLRPDQQQMVEIARALSQDARVLILDEPTSSLTDDEVVALFAAIRRMRDDGVSTVFVSHRIGETFELVDEVTVLRDGLTVAQDEIGAFDPDSLVGTMVGRTESAEPTAPSRVDVQVAGGHRALAVEGLTVPGHVEGVGLDLRPGEIVGLAGLVGAGRSELLEGIFGLTPQREGVVEVDGEELAHGEPRTAIRLGVGYLPADRKVQGLVLKRSVAENLAMVDTFQRPRLSRPSRHKEEVLVGDLMRSLGVKAASPHALAGSLSGGNQQKVALGKWLTPGRKVLLLNEPTRGVDVAAKAEIHGLLARAAEEGLALLVSSSENPELVGLCHRILVMFRGRVVAELGRDAAPETQITRYAGGHN